MHAWPSDFDQARVDEHFDASTLERPSQFPQIVVPGGVVTRDGNRVTTDLPDYRGDRGQISEDGNTDATYVADLVTWQTNPDHLHPAMLLSVEASGEFAHRLGGADDNDLSDVGTGPLPAMEPFSREVTNQGAHHHGEWHADNHQLEKRLMPKEASWECARDNQANSGTQHCAKFFSPEAHTVANVTPG
ncbi:hypothetical protein GCM10022204_43950 [Microlunatus aurantiacus]|uniref:Uncharacterized protein n=1 Tax=Microlunatus aurantiacus TaxID=446786 RepID=A0ABP7EHT2_9ACTN